MVEKWWRGGVLCNERRRKSVKHRLKNTTTTECVEGERTNGASEAKKEALKPNCNNVLQQESLQQNDHKSNKQHYLENKNDSLTYGV